MTNADVISAQLEKVRPKLPEIFETSNLVFARLTKNTEVERVSSRDYRIPLVVAFGGDYRTFNLDKGDMGRGSGPMIRHMATTYFPTLLAIELGNLGMYATASSEQAVAKAFAIATANAIRNLQAYEDISLHTAGTGVIGTATGHTTAGGKSVYTMDDEFGVQMLRRGMPVHVYNNALSVHRTSGVAVDSRRVEAINYADNTVTLSSTISGASTGDRLVFDGVSGTPPTWKKGIPFFLSTATTGTLLGLSRADFPEIISNWVNAAGALNGLHGMLLLDMVEQRRDNTGDLLALFHMRQRTAWYQQGIAISEWQRGKADQMVDLVPKRSSEFSFAGVTAVTDKHQSRTRVDMISPKNWGRAVLKDLDWYQVGDKKMFELRGTSGGLAAGILMYLEIHSDWYTDDPGAQGFIHSLSLP